MALFDFSVDDQLRITGCNGAFGRMRVESSQQLEGLPYYEVVPRILHQNRDGVLQVVESRQPLSLSGYRFGCFHQSFEADVTIQPLPGGNGTSAGAQVVIQDLQKCEMASRLQQSQHLIDIGKMASILSHGVRNPLNAIKGAVVYLKNRYGHEANLVEFTDIMEDEITRLDKFITGFLSTSIYEFDQSAVDLNSLLKKIELFTSLQAKTAGVEVSFRSGQVDTIQINAFQVEHAILNVVNNALHALPIGGKIDISSNTENRPEGRFAVVEILDNGPGMPGQGAETFAAPVRESAQAKGKGFGLFITREILQHHGGLLEIHSGLDRGTQVKLLFPAANGGQG